MRHANPSRRDFNEDPFAADVQPIHRAAGEPARDNPPDVIESRTAHTIKDYCDHLRALVAYRSRPGTETVNLRTIVESTVERLLSYQQQTDGSFVNEGSRFKPVEPTAHALLALSEAGLEPRHDAIQKGLNFLEQQVRPDGSVRSASDAEDAGWPDGPRLTPEFQECLPPGIGVRRTHVAALALMALTAWQGTSQAADGIRDFLLQNCKDGLWGPYPEAPPSPATTALALYALSTCSQGLQDSHRGTAYLRQTQRSGGWWPQEHEMWAVRNQDGLHVEITRIDTNSFALLTLVRAGSPSRLLTAARAFRYLKAERRFEEERWAHPAKRCPPMIPPSGNAADEIAATLAKTGPPLTLLASALMRPPTKLLHGGSVPT